MSVSHPFLLGYALGALDPGDAMAMDQALSTDISSRFRLNGWQALMNGVGASQENAPPMQPVALAAEIEAPGTLGDDDMLVSGDRLTVRVEPQLAPDEVRCVLFREVEGRRDLLHPLPGQSWPRLSQFRADGPARMLDVVIAPPAGHHRYTLVVVPADVYEEGWEPTDPRWDAVLAAHESGGLPGARFDTEVAASP